MAVRLVGGRCGEVGMGRWPVLMCWVVRKMVKRASHAMYTRVTGMLLWFEVGGSCLDDIMVFWSLEVLDREHLQLEVNCL